MRTMCKIYIKIKKYACRTNAPTFEKKNNSNKWAHGKTNDAKYIIFSV